MQINNQFSSIRGKIALLLMAVTDIDGEDQYGRILAVLQSLREHTGLLVWCNSQTVMKTVGQWLQQHGVDAERRLLNEELPATFRCVLLAPEGEYVLTKYSHWVRDPFVSKWDETGQLTLLGSTDAKNEDSWWVPLHLKHLKLAKNELIVAKNNTIPVAGGNILFDADFVLVGAKQFRDSQKLSGSPDARGELLGHMNGNCPSTPFLRVIEIGAHTGQEPPWLVHLDLYLSLTGMRDAGGHYIVLLGRCEPVVATAHPEPDVLQVIDRMNEYLEQVAEQLTHAGFLVQRNPLPILHQESVADSYLCAYNNCLTEVAEGLKPTVWLAKLTHRRENEIYYEHLKRLENENIALWETLGFEVRLVEANFHSILDDQGSLHCITNELLRN